MSYQLEFRHIKCFLAVAEDLHFRKAAERLFISQPGLSRQIKQMEEKLGIVLFERHNRKVILTRAGEYLKKELTINLKNIEHTFNHAKLLNDGKRGDLKFGYVGSAMQEIIPSLLVKFKNEYPNIVFSLKEMDNPILKESFCLVLPKEHLIDERNFKSLRQFKKESFILFDPKYSSSYFEKVMQIFDDSGFSPVISHNTIHAGSIYKLVENDFGISIVPKSLIEKSNKKIKFIELNKIKQKTTLSVVWNTNNRNPILKEIVKLL